jgi:hypothetical protein
MVRDKVPSSGSAIDLLVKARAKDAHAQTADGALTNCNLVAQTHSLLVAGARGRAAAWLRAGLIGRRRQGGAQGTAAGGFR